MTTEFKRMQQLRGDTALWASNDIIPLDGELAFERVTDGTARLKVGNGRDSYSALPYFLGNSGAFRYLGTADVTIPPPAGSEPGDCYSPAGAATVAASWGAPAAGQAVIPADLLVMDVTAKWNVLRQAGGFVRSVDLAATTGASMVGYAAPGSGAVPRTALQKFRERGLSVIDFGANADSNGTPGNGIDNRPAFLAAYAAAIAAGIRLVYVPSAPTGFCYRLSDELLFSDSVIFYGAGVQVYSGASINPTAYRGAGSWLYRDHARRGLVIDPGSNNASGFGIFGLGFISNQPASAPGWTPAANDFDLTVIGADCAIDDLCFFNSTNGVNHDYAGYGRLRIGYIYGDVYSCGLRVNRCLDLMRIGGIHWWPYSGTDPNRAAYKLAHLVGFNSFRCDGAMIGRYFCIGSMAGFYIQGDGGGATSHLMVDQAYTDLFGNFSVYVDASAPNTTLELQTLLGQGAIAADGNAAGASAGIVVAGNNCVVKVAQTQLNRVNNQIAVVTGTGSRCQLGQVSIEDWNRLNNGSVAFDAPAAGSSIVLGDIVHAINNATPGSKLLAASNTRVSSREWVDETPVPVTTGSGFSGTCTFSRQLIGNKVFYNFVLGVVNVGTGSPPSINIPLTIPPRAGKTYTGSGMNATGGQQLKFNVSSQFKLIAITLYSNVFPAINGDQLYGTGWYECDPY
jgi:hypothetical protein